MPFGPQTANSPLHLAVTEGEIRDYGKMMQVGHNVKLGDLESAFDYLAAKLGPKLSLAGSVDGFLSDTGLSTNKSVFYLQSFLRELNMTHRDNPSSAFTHESQLDAVQDGYIVLRTEAMCTVKTSYHHSDSDQPSQRTDTSGTANQPILPSAQGDLMIDPGSLTNGGIKIPLKGSSSSDEGVGGSATVPCTCKGQHASLIISVSIVSKKRASGQK